MFNIARATGLGAIAALSLGLSAATSEAAVIYATSVDQYNQGAGVVAPRDNTDNALGAADGSFLALGLGGDATFSFGQVFGSPGAVFEITFGKRSNHIEKATIIGILGGIETVIAFIANGASESVFTFTGIFDQLKIVDTSPIGGGSVDGFDIDAVKVSTVPLPAGGLLLAGALGGIAALRRRKTA